MVIWVIGQSSTGKSSVAKAVQEVTSYPVYSAGSWVRDQFPSKDVPRELLETYAVNVLRKDCFLSANLIKKEIEQNPKGLIVEGCRNPTDFFSCYQHGKDVVVIAATNKIVTYKGFDAGVDVILKGIKWNKENINEDFLYLISVFDERISVSERVEKVKVFFKEKWKP